MRHRKHTFRLGRQPAHVDAMIANQVCSLILEGQIKTTLAKAKEIRRHAEKMVTLGKKGTIAHRRRAASKLKHEGAVNHLFTEIAPRYLQRDGGYTRILRLGQRRGDAARMCLLQWVERDTAPAE